MKNKFTLRLFAVNAMYWAAMAFYTPYIGAYYTSHGIPASQIGILTSVGPILSICVQPVWAALSDRTGRRKLILVGVAALSAGAILLYLTASSFVMFMVSTIAFMSFQTALMPLADALVTNIGAREGVKFSTVRMGGTIAFAVVVFILGRIITPEKQYILFPACAVAIMIFAATVAALPSDSKYAPAIVPVAGEENEKKNEPKGKIFKTNMIVFVLFIIFIIQFGLGYNGNFFGVYITNLGYSRFIIGVTSCLSALSELPVLFFADRIINRLGYMKTFLFSAVCVVARMCLAGTGILPVMILSTVLQGPSYILTYYAGVRFINQYAFQDKISQGQSALSIVQVGLGCVISNILGGVMSDKFGIGSTYYIIGIGTLVVAAVFATVYRIYARNHPEEAKATE